MSCVNSGRISFPISNTRITCVYAFNAFSFVMHEMLNIHRSHASARLISSHLFSSLLSFPPSAARTTKLNPSAVVVVAAVAATNNSQIRFFFFPIHCGHTWSFAYKVDQCQCKPHLPSGCDLSRADPIVHRKRINEWLMRVSTTADFDEKNGRRIGVNDLST